MMSKQFKTPQDISYDVMQVGLDVSFRGPDSNEYEQHFLYYQFFVKHAISLKEKC